MNKKEYQLICKAIFHFMEDEPVSGLNSIEEFDAYQGGWESGMGILAHLKERYENYHSRIIRFEKTTKVDSDAYLEGIMKNSR